MVEATLESIVSPEEVKSDWTKIKATTPLGKFHHKFWGKSMQDEAHEWHPTVNGGRSELDAVGDDIIPGCHLLDLEGYGFPHDKIWIRADYIRIYDYFVERYNRLARERNFAPAAVLTGQPGIGKSLWIFYAIRRCLAERRPVIWINQGCSFLFVAEGVFDLPPYFYQVDFRRVVWTLVDADDPESQAGPPPRLISLGTPLSVMYVSSPRELRWSRMYKALPTTIVTMNPWTKQELYHAASTLPRSRIDKIFDLYGPTPRLCFAPEEYSHDVDAEISTLTTTNLRKYISNSSVFTMTPTSSKLLLLTRTQRHKVHSLPRVTPISAAIRSKMAVHLRKAEVYKLGILYRTLSETPYAEEMAQLIYEVIVQQRLREGMELDVVAMVKPGPASSLKRKRSETDLPERGLQPRWYSAHTPLLDAPLGEFRAKAVQGGCKVVIQPSQVQDVDEAPQCIMPNTLYVHSAVQPTGFGSFILLEGLLYIFQPTIAPEHEIPLTLVDYFIHLPGAPSVRDWRFVFVIPRKETLMSPESANVQLQAVCRCSAIVPPESWNILHNFYVSAAALDLWPLGQASP